MKVEISIVDLFGGYGEGKLIKEKVIFRENDKLYAQVNTLGEFLNLADRLHEEYQIVTIWKENDGHYTLDVFDDWE